MSPCEHAGTCPAPPPHTDTNIHRHEDNPSHMYRQKDTKVIERHFDMYIHGQTQGLEAWDRLWVPPPCPHCSFSHPAWLDASELSTCPHIVQLDGQELWILSRTSGQVLESAQPSLALSVTDYDRIDLCSLESHCCLLGHLMGEDAETRDKVDTRELRIQRPEL